MWIWRVVTNPVAGDYAVRAFGAPYAVFSVFGIFVSHNNTAPVTVRVQVTHSETGTVAHYFDVVVPASSTFVLYSPDDALITEIGREYDEVLNVLVMTGGTYTISTGICIRGMPWSVWGRT